MISWRFPLFLVLLALVPLTVAFLWWALRRRHEALARFAESHLVQALTPGLDTRRWRWRAILMAAAVALMAVSVAGPQWGFHWEEVRREGVDLIIAIDTSRSMLAEDVKPNRLERAKLALEDLLKQLKGDRIGLVAFAGSAFVQCPLTLDYQAFAESLRATSVGIIPKGGTAIGEAITKSVEAFEGHQGKHTAIILITDGEDQDGKIDEAAKNAADLGIKIYTVGIGSADGDLIPVTVNGQQTFVKDRKGQVVKSRLDEESLQKIAATTSGAFVRAAGPTLGLDQLYKEHISQLDKRELASTMEKRFEDRFQWPLGLALLLLMIEPLLGNRKRESRQPVVTSKRSAVTR